MYIVIHTFLPLTKEHPRGYTQHKYCSSRKYHTHNTYGNTNDYYHSATEKAAIRMLPIHVARRETEHCIASVALGKDTLNDAFKVLRDNLDPVIDEFEAVRRYYGMHWACGEGRAKEVYSGLSQT